MPKSSFLATVGALALSLLAACSPKYNWRDYSPPDAAYRVMFPAKPASYSRTINLDGKPVEMSMTAAEVDGAVFAVGAAQAADAAAAQAALAALKTALVRNINGTITSEKVAASASSGSAKASQAASSDVQAEGSHQGVRMRLVGHFEARDKRFYQVIVMGPAKAIVPEQAEQFLSSFKAQ